MNELPPYRVCEPADQDMNDARAYLGHLMRVGGLPALSTEMEDTIIRQIESVDQVRLLIQSTDTTETKRAKYVQTVLVEAVVRLGVPRRQAEDLTELEDNPACVLELYRRVRHTAPRATDASDSLFSDFKCKMCTIL